MINSATSPSDATAGSSARRSCDVNAECASKTEMKAIAKPIIRHILSTHFFDTKQRQVSMLGREAGTLFASIGRLCVDCGLAHEFRKVVHNMSLAHRWLDPVHELVAQMIKREGSSSSDPLSSI